MQWCYGEKIAFSFVRSVVDLIKLTWARNVQLRYKNKIESDKLIVMQMFPGEEETLLLIAKLKALVNEIIVEKYQKQSDFTRPLLL